MIAFADADPLDLEGDLMPTDEAERRAIEAIITAPWAWSPIAALITAGHEPATLAALEKAQLVVRWDLPREPSLPASPPGSPAAALTMPPSGPSLTLTPAAARRLGVEIVEEGWIERPRFGLPAEVRAYVRVQRFARGIRFPEQLQSPAPGPLQELLMREAWDQDNDRPVIDPQTGEVKKEPVQLWGRVIPIDRRLKPLKVTRKPRQARTRTRAK